MTAKQEVEYLRFKIRNFKDEAFRNPNVLKTVHENFLSYQKLLDDLKKAEDSLEVSRVQKSKTVHKYIEGKDWDEETKSIYLRTFRYGVDWGGQIVLLYKGKERFIFKKLSGTAYLNRMSGSVSSPVIHFCVDSSIESKQMGMETVSKNVVYQIENKISKEKIQLLKDWADCKIDKVEF